MSDRPILKLPKQVQPRRKRTASAPYNFVPLPERVVTAVDEARELPDHDRFIAGKQTGYFEVTLTTRSPFYIRGPLQLARFLAQGLESETKKPFRQQAKNVPDFFFRHDPNCPVVPGSSLRGMLRHLLEMVSYGKLNGVSDTHKMFYRAVAAPKDDPLGAAYRQALDTRVRAGYLHQQGDDWYVQPAKQTADMGWTCTRRENAPYLKIKDATVASHALPGFIPIHPTGYGYRPQYHSVSYDVDPCQGKNGRYVVLSEIGPPEIGHPFQGVLVCSGDMNETGGAETTTERKRHALVLERAQTEPLKINPQSIRDYLDALTPFQTEPPFDERMGCLRDGYPVFYLEEDGEVLLFGHSPNFRIPYLIGERSSKRAATPVDFVPTALRRPEDIDYPDALFGYVRTRKELKDMELRGMAPPAQGDKSRAYAGRVTVTDATLLSGQSDIWFSETPMIPKILATPKPTAFQHYLVQSDDPQSTLRHYGSVTPADTVIRGYKRYWHQGLSEEAGLIKEKIHEAISEEPAILDEIAKQEAQGVPDTQHTAIKPVRPGVKFTFRVYFENVSDEELGAMCWTLQPLGDSTKRYHHQLGMAKPLGLGAVELNATLHLSDRKQRYSALFNSGEWQIGMSKTSRSLADRNVLIELTSAFERHVLRELKMDGMCQHLFELKRIGMLLKMLEWPGFAPERTAQPFIEQAHAARPNTRYMHIKPDEYRDRLVLPAPDRFGALTGEAEPEPVSASVPTPAVDQPQPVTQERPERLTAKPTVRPASGRPSSAKRPEPSQPAEAAASKTTYKKGDKIQVEVVDRSGNEWSLRIVATGQHITCTKLYLPWKIADKRSVKVVAVDSEGRIKSVQPS